jgi:hypothetical protein
LGNFVNLRRIRVACTDNRNVCTLWPKTCTNPEKRGTFWRSCGTPGRRAGWRFRHQSVQTKCQYGLQRGGFWVLPGAYRMRGRNARNLASDRHEKRVSFRFFSRNLLRAWEGRYTENEMGGKTGFGKACYAAFPACHSSSPMCWRFIFG